MSLPMPSPFRHALVGGMFALLLGALPSTAADAPGYARVPVVVQYDVDPSWPKRPEQLKPWGAVTGMAVDEKDRIWVLSRCEDPVQVYTADGTFVRTWGRGSFDSPHCLRIDHEGNVWISDFGLHVVQKYTPEGRLLFTLGVRGEKGDDGTHFNRPTDMAITPTGDVFVTDGYGNRRVVHFDPGGKFIKSWGSYGTEPDQFVLPHAILIDSQGTLYVGDRNSGRILLFDQSGKPIDQWLNLIMPWGMSITKSDDVWVCGSSPHWWYRDGKYCEFKDQLLMRFSTDGRVRQVWSLPLGDPKNPKPGETVGVHAIVQDSKGNLYLGDAYGNRAQKLVPVTARPESKSE